MNLELFIENYRLDVSAEYSALLTFFLDDLREFGARSTAVSKTIVLPGTANNNKRFGHIFNIGHATSHNPAISNVNQNFNSAKSADCIVFQNHMQTFKGKLRLLQIVNYSGRIEYEVGIVGDVAGLTTSLSSSLLENLDFSAYDHTYNETNIVSSWSNAGGSGYYYPLIDYGNYSALKKDWDIRTFRPALYVKEYIDKMFSAAGYRYDCDLFNTTRFKKLIIPHNQKTLTKRGSSLLTAQILTSAPYNPYIVNGASLVTVKFDSISGTDFSGTPPPPPEEIKYTGSGSIYVDLNITASGLYTSDFGINVDLRKVSGGIIASTTLAGVPGTPDVPFSINFNLTGVLFNTNDYFYISLANVDIDYDSSVTISSSSIAIGSQNTTIINVNPGDQVSLNDTIPKNIRQYDFFSSIIQLFNLYVWEDKFDSRLIHIKPYVDFYSTNSADSVDWTYKLDRDKPIIIKPMSELTARKYEFKFKQDSDYYNELYRKRYSNGYGNYIYDSQYEFTEQTKSIEIILSATPLVGYAGEDKVYSTIFKRNGNPPTITEEQIDSNIRILQSKKITGVNGWDIKDGSTVLTSTTDYGYAGHLDDPDAPANDLNFGVPQELFFILASGALNINQFNVYYSSYLAEITDKDSKLVTGSFYLTPKDIIDLDFSKKVYIDGILYKLSKISDFNLTSPASCKAELLKCNYLIY